MQRPKFRAKGKKVPKSGSSRSRSSSSESRKQTRRMDPKERASVGEIFKAKLIEKGQISGFKSPDKGMKLQKERSSSRSPSPPSKLKQPKAELNIIS